MTNIMVKANLKIDAGRESNSHSKYAVLNKCARIIADVILKATHDNAPGRRGRALSGRATGRALSQSNSKAAVAGPNPQAQTNDDVLLI